MIRRTAVLLFPLAACCWQACSPTRSVATVAKNPLQLLVDTTLLQQPGLLSAQVGICLYDPATSSYKYRYQGDKYFIPASNTKLFSLYAGLKYLGDSLVGMRYQQTDTALSIVPSGDPTLLHPDYPRQPVIDRLKKSKGSIYLTSSNWQDRPLGRGWAWDDYNDDYMPERSPFPVYGNLIRWVDDTVSGSFYSIPDINWPVHFSTDTSKKNFSIRRDFHGNVFEITEGKGKWQDVPFITEGTASAALLLKDTVGRPVLTRDRIPGIAGIGASDAAGAEHTGVWDVGLQVIHSQPVDSLFRPMMYRSDNFFAEQTLLMVSNERLGRMSDARIIDTLLKTDLKDLPQRPNWVDGCGLSRNDLFTPEDFVWLLDKMQREFGLDRMKRILPTGGTGTLSSYYKEDKGFIFAKTGSLSGVVALSGYLITKKDHLLIFSILVNNNNDPILRRKIEKVIHWIRDRY